MKFLLYPGFYLLGSALKEAIPGLAGIASDRSSFDAVETVEM